MAQTAKGKGPSIVLCHLCSKSSILVLSYFSPLSFRTSINFQNLQARHVLPFPRVISKYQSVAWIYAGPGTFFWLLIASGKCSWCLYFRVLFVNPFCTIWLAILHPLNICIKHGGGACFFALLFWCFEGRTTWGNPNWGVRISGRSNWQSVEEANFRQEVNHERKLIVHKNQLRPLEESDYDLRMQSRIANGHDMKDGELAETYTCPPDLVSNVNISPVKWLIWLLLSWTSHLY